MKYFAPNHRTSRRNRFPAGTEIVLLQNTWFSLDATLPFSTGTSYAYESTCPNSRKTHTKYLIQCHWIFAELWDQ